MPDAIYYFPRNFLWGTATSAFQTEGLNSNTNWSVWENTPGKIFNGQISGKACNWWAGAWKDDLNRAQSTYQNAHRMSIEWSRIQPAFDRWDQSALDHYRQMLQGMIERQITPIVTLHHFTEPLWIYEKGGWENPEIVGLFSEFVRRSVESLKEFCNHWITINEPNIYVYEGYIEGVFPPGKRDLGTAFNVMENMIKGHIAAYDLIHSIDSNSKVGIASNYRPFWPNKKWSAADQMISRILDKNFNQSFIDCVMTGKLSFTLKSRNIPQAKHKLDFIGINYYSADNIKFNVLNARNLFFESLHPGGSKVSENGFISNNPKGLVEAISWASKFNLPIYITENGIEDSKDILRPVYLLEHLYQLWRAANLNPLIKGYFHWTLVDNFEWERGWSQRFGLWGLDTSNQMRIHRNSVDLFSLICKGNNINPKIVNKFCPEIHKKIFPE